MDFQGRAMALNNRAVMIDGVKGEVEMICHHDEANFAAVVVLKNGSSVRFDRIDSLEKVLIADQSAQSSRNSGRTSSRRNQNAPSGSNPPITRSRKKNIALPPVGGTASRYMLGVTGRWYPKELCCKKGDIPLSTWIDREYDPDGAWPGEKICDQRRDPAGRIQFLVKFKRYELNPGVQDDESNEGDWFYRSQNIGKDLIAAWKRKRASYGLGAMGDSDVPSSSSSDSEDEDEDPAPTRCRKKRSSAAAPQRITRSRRRMITYGP